MAERLERSERCPACGGSPPDLVDFGLFAVEEGVAIGEAVRCGQGRFIVDRHGGGHVALVAVLVEKRLALCPFGGLLRFPWRGNCNWRRGERGGDAVVHSVAAVAAPFRDGRGSLRRPCELARVRPADGGGDGSVGARHRDSRCGLLCACILVVLRYIVARYRGQFDDAALGMGGELFRKDVLRILYGRGGDAGDFNGPYGRQLDIASRAEPPDRPCLADGDVLFR